MLEVFTIPKYGPGEALHDVNLNQGLVAAVLDALSDHDALFITEEGSFEQCHELARSFLKLPPKQRAKLVDALSANLHTLATSARSLLSIDDGAEPEVILRHKNGFNMLMCLLQIIAMKAEKDLQQAKGTENAAKPKAGRGRKAATAAMDDDESWDWQRSRQGVLLSVRELMLVDLKALFKGLAAAEQLINLSMELALQDLECPTVAKQNAWPACCDVLVLGAVQYQQLDFVASALFERAQQHDHLPKLVALLAKYTEEQCNNTQLGVKLLSEFCRTAPEDYDMKYSTNAASVRRAGEVLSYLAELLPKVVSNNISQLQPYLGCKKAHSLRGALLEAIGSILVKVFPMGNFSSGLGEGAAAAHARSKEALLALLHARVLDKAAFVRQKVMQIWARLVEEKCVPLPQWNSLLAQAIGRLEDESQLVIKAALQLMYTMVEQSIIWPPLKQDIYQNTLRTHEAKLKEMLPQQGEDAEAAGDAGACWGDGTVQIKEDEQMENADVDELPNSKTGGSCSAAAIHRQRVMVSTLKEGVSFCKRLSAALQQLQVLLAHPVAAVVHSAIVFLTLCKKFEVSGAAKALRGMWPLVFSKHEPVRQAVLDSWHILHLHDKKLTQQLDELLTNVIPGSSLAELTALESIIGSLVQQDKLPAEAVMKALVSKICHAYTQLDNLPPAALQQTAQQEHPQQCTEPDDAMDTDEQAITCPRQQAATPAAILLRSLRNAFALLSMLTAAQPSALSPVYVPVLLEVGFSSKLGDAWVVRHTCLALRHAAAHLTPLSSMQAAVGKALSGPAAAKAPSSRVAIRGSDLVDPDVLHNLLAAIVRFLVTPPTPILEANWASAAEAAIGALYALSLQPQGLMEQVLQEMFVRCKPGNANDPAANNFSYSSAALSRFFFALGRTALQQLLCIEQISKAIRAARLAADRAAAEAAERQHEAAAAGSRKSSAKGHQQQQQEDIGALLGVGCVADDAALDALAEAAENQVLAKGQLLGMFGQLLSRFCHMKALLSAPQQLQATALLALTQLMAVDVQFCSDNVALLFTLLVRKHVSAEIRVNMVVSLADLASRFPNVLEQWTSWIYEPLKDPEPAVKLAALSGLTHLVLGGVVKAKGNVAKVAALLVDDSPEIVDRAVLFFESLAKTGSGSTRTASAAAGASAANPVYNLLPDCLSALLSDDRLRQEQLQVIMGQLLGYVKDKQADSLRERLVVRLAAGGPREWRTVAWCIGQLGYTEKGLRRVVELTPGYRHALGEQQVFDVFMMLADKARRSAGSSKATAAAETALQSLAGAQGELCSVVEEWVADLVASREAAIEAAEVEAAEAARRQTEQPGSTGSAELGRMFEESAAEPAEQATTGVGQMQQDQQDPMAAGNSPMPAEEAPDGPTAVAGAAVIAAVLDEDSSRNGGEEQIALMQSQDVADLDDVGEVAEVEATAARLRRMSLVAGRPASAAATPATALSSGRSQRKDSAAAGGEGGMTAKRRPKSNTVAAAAGVTARGRRASQTAAVAKRGTAKETRKSFSSDDSDGSSSSAVEDSEDEASSSSSDRDDATTGDQQPAASTGRASRVSAATAAGKRAAGRASSAWQQQERFVAVDDSEDDD